MLYLKKDIASTVLGIWRIDESQDTLLGLLDNRQWIKDILLMKSEPKRLEKLAVRVLLKELLGEEKHICYLESGKPCLEDGSYQISISHTKGYVAVIIDKEHPVGIDIEQITDKVKRVRSRFISDKEYIDPDQELIHLLLHWSAKETVYKLLDIAGIELKEETIVQRFIPEQEGIFNILETRSNRMLNISYQIDTDFVLTYLSGS